MDTKIKQAVSIITKLLDVIEESNPDYYYKSDYVAYTDDWLKESKDENPDIQDKCIDSLNFLEQSGVLTQEQQQEIECSIMNLEVDKNG